MPRRTAPPPPDAPETAEPTALTGEQKTLISEREAQIEVIRCAASHLYFITVYCQIYDAQAEGWIPFELWPQQITALDTIHENQFTIALKARQLGMSWLALSYILWLMLFRPVTTALVFSRRDDEAVYLLNEERLKGMYARLPPWLQVAKVVLDNAHQWGLDNGSIARAFPAQGGDSYTANVVLVDEADIIPDLPRLMRSVKPTVDAGGKLIMISRVDKNKPASMFKSIYRAAKAGRNGWASIFLPWWIRPERTPAWYAALRQEIIERTGSDDELKEQYPGTDIEALEPASLNKRIPGEWLTACYSERPALTRPSAAPAIEGLTIYDLPQSGVEYVAGADCAEGLPSSDDSVTQWLRRDTREQVAVLRGKFTPADQAARSFAVSGWYNSAPILIERNNHGHALINWYVMSGHSKVLVDGRDGRPGWNDDALGKTLLYDEIAEAARGQDVVIHDLDTFAQLASIERATLRGPSGELDDLADAFALAVLAARLAARKGTGRSGRFTPSGLYRSRESGVKSDPRW